MEDKIERLEKLIEQKDLEIEEKDLEIYNLKSRLEEISDLIDKLYFIS